MATRLYLRNTQTNGLGANYYDLSTTQGPSVAIATVSTAPGSSSYQWTMTAGGAAIQWVSPPLVAPLTLTNTNIAIWVAQVINPNLRDIGVNAGGQYRVFKRTAAGVETELGGGPFNDGVEFSTVSSLMTWTGNVADTTFAIGDRILLKLYAAGLNREITIASNVNSIVLRALYDATYPAPVSGDNVIFTINAGVIVGAINASTVALQVGSWPAGVTVNLINKGRIQGAGGAGYAIHGSPGYTALHTARAINLVTTGAQIWGGGGGGGSGTDGNNIFAGGGGAGTIGGPGGISRDESGYGLIDATPGSSEGGGTAAYSYEFSRYAGHGGGPGNSGNSAGGWPAGYQSGSGGSYGWFIDGYSYCTFGSWNDTTKTFTPGAHGGDLRGGYGN